MRGQILAKRSGCVNHRSRWEIAPAAGRPAPTTIFPARRGSDLPTPPFSLAIIVAIQVIKRVGATGRRADAPAGPDAFGPFSWERITP
jgi:hypothetical protein